MTEGKSPEQNCRNKNTQIHWIVIIILAYYCCKATSQTLPLKPPRILQKGVEVWYRIGDKLTLKCEGDRPVVWSHSNLNLTTDPRANWTSTSSSLHSSTLTLEQLKLTDIGVVFCRYEAPQLSAYVDTIYVNIGTADKGMSATGKTVLGVIIGICIIAFVILIVFRVVIKARSKKPTEKYDDSETQGGETERCLGEKSENEFYKGAVEYIDPQMSISDQANLLPFESHWEFPRDRLQLGPQLGSGAFGRVVKAEAIGLLETEPSTTVAVKMLKPNADESHLKALMCELKIMAHLGKHINVVNLLGACTKQIATANNELLVIVEYCKHGSLLNYIRRYNKSFVDQVVRNGSENDFVDPTITTVIRPMSTAEGGNATYSNSKGASSSNLYSGSTDQKTSQYELQTIDSQRELCGQSITTTDLLCWAFQIARGMEYLSSRKVIHGDLATRNVLLTENNVVKICDFGLAKDMYKDYNYIMSTKGGNFPVKWMAIESIYYGELSTESDCWSFGVVLWELFSLGKIPYPGVKADEDLIKRIDQGYRMQKPEYAPSDIYKMMLECWAHDKKERPPFPGLVNRIGYMMDQKLRDYLVELNAEYERRNQMAATAVPQSNNSQLFPELDSYGYLKPIEMGKPISESLASQPQPSAPAEPSKSRESNFYVPDPTSSTKDKHTEQDAPDHNENNT